VDAPDVYGKILKDERTSPRARLEAGRELRVVAANNDAGAVNAGQQFVININLAGRTERYEKTITPRHDAIDDVGDEVATPWGLIAANKQGDDGSGEPL
jgi:hypothetical protein